MNVLFSNAVLWPFAALIAVPILLHLFARARPRVYLYSSLQFLRRAVREQQRVKKPRDWLLLLARTAWYAALIAAFLQPLWFGGRPSAAAAGRTVVLVVDATASMAARDGAQSHFATACAEAAEILTGLTSRDRANLIWMRAVPRAVFPQPGVNIGYLRNSLRQGRVSTEAADPAAALRLAADMLRDAPGRAEICVVSDFQRTTWRSLGVAVPDGVALVTIPVTKDVVPNLAIARVATRPVQPLAGEEIQAFVEVRNFSPAPRQTVVHAEIGELRSARNVQVPAWGAATAAFVFRAEQPGQAIVAARIEEDEFPDDNAAWRVVDVKPGLRAGLLAANRPTAAAWRRALNALSWAQAVDLPPEGWEAEAARCDALLLCGWDGQGADAVRAAMARGAPVLWYPARNSPAGALGALTDSSAQGVFGWVSPARPLMLQMADAADPAFAVFAGGDRGNPASGAFRGRLSIPSLSADWRPLLNYSDGAPALARYKPSGGTLVLWNLDLAPETSSWATRMEFLPLFGEVLLSSRHADAGADGAPLSTGRPLTLRSDRDLLPQAIRVEAPDGQLHPVSRHTESGPPVYAAGAAERPGLYAWRIEEEVIARTAVNFPPEESDLRPIPPSEISRKGWTALSGGRAARERREGIPLWPWFLGLACASCVGEALLSWYAVKK